MDILLINNNTDLLPVQLFGTQNINNNNRDPSENFPNETLVNQNNDILPYIEFISDKSVNLNAEYIDNTEMVTEGRKRIKLNIKQEKRLKKNTLKYEWNLNSCTYTTKVKEKIYYASQLTEEEIN